MSKSNESGGRVTSKFREGDWVVTNKDFDSYEVPTKGSKGMVLSTRPYTVVLVDFGPVLGEFCCYDKWLDHCNDQQS